MDNLQQIKKVYDEGNAHTQSAIENAILDRVKRDWNSLPAVSKQQALTLAKINGRLEEFSALDC